MDRFTAHKTERPELLACIHCPKYSNCYSGFSCSEIYNALSKLRYYENLEEQGKLVTLPCKVGDSLFTYSWGCHGSHDDCWEQDDCDECPHLLKEIREYKFKNIVHILNAEKYFGKTIFLTREEAEAATRGENNDNDI